MKFHDRRFGHRRHVERAGFERSEAVEALLRHRYGGSRGGGRGEGGRFFERGQFKFALLELLAAGPMHGYQLMKAMADATGGLYAPSPGSVYPNLQLLEDMGLIESGETDGKKLYRITAEGIAVLRERGMADDAGRMEHRREHIERLRQRGGGFGRDSLRSLMKEWPEAVYLLASAAEAAREQPSSEQAVRFRELMAKLREGLKELEDAEEGEEGGPQAEQ